MPNPSRTRIRTLLAVALAAMFLQAGPLPAADEADPYWEYRSEVDRGEFNYDDSQDIPWIENEAEILAMPAREDLERVTMDQLPEGFELYVDRSRITVDPKDRVIRLWLWMRNPAGNENGTFEGFRCETREYKVYAYANPRRDPPVSKAKKSRWREATEQRIGNYRLELLNDYFCGIRGTRSAQEIEQFMTGPYRRERFLSE